MARGLRKLPQRKGGGLSFAMSDDPKPLTDAELMRIKAYEIAKELSKEIGVMFIVENGKCLTYHKNDGIWRNDNLAQVTAALEEKEKEGNTVGYQRLVIQHIKDANHHSIQELDQPRYLPLSNCVIDLETKQVLEHSPDLKLTFKLPIQYDPTNREMKVLEFLRGRFSHLSDGQTIVDNVRLRHFLECVASGFVRQPRKRQIHILRGGTDTGKTTTLNLLTVMYGEENVRHKSLAQLGGGDKWSAADLRNALANITSELKEQVILNTEVLKAITGGDRIDAQEKYGQPFSIYPSCEYFAGLNKLPQIDFKLNPDLEEDFAFWGRFDIIPFDNHVPTRDQNENLVDVKRPEKGELSNSVQLSGFFNILLPIIFRIYHNGATNYNPTPIETKQIWLGDLPVVKCVRELCDKDPRGIVLVSELWELWEDWRKDRRHEYGVISQMEFNDIVEEHLGAKRTATKDRHRRSVKVWTGLTLKKNGIKVKAENQSLDSNIPIEDMLSTDSTAFSINFLPPISFRTNRERKYSSKTVDLVDTLLKSKNGVSEELKQWFLNPLKFSYPPCTVHRECIAKNKTFPTRACLATHLAITGRAEGLFQCTCHTWFLSKEEADYCLQNNHPSSLLAIRAANNASPDVRKEFSERLANHSLDDPRGHLGTELGDE
ncbi:MAG: DUF5906 domain-containing protein [Nitrososphaerales archaeon]